MANQDSIFYKIGQQVRESINDSISSVPQLNADNLFYGANKFYGNTQIGSQTGFTLTANSGLDNKIQIYGINNGQTYTNYTVSKANNGSNNASTASFATNSLIISINVENTTETLADLVAIVNGGTLGDSFYAFLIDPTTSSELSSTIDAIAQTPFASSHGGKLTVVNDATFTNNVSISGDLIVTGSTTTLTSSELQIEDNFITLSKGANVSADYWRDSGLYFERALNVNNTAFLWDESKEEFVLGEISSSGVQYHTIIAPDTTNFSLSGTDVTAASGAVVSTGINGTAATIINLNLGDSLRFTGNFGGGLDIELRDPSNNPVDLVKDDGTIVQQFTEGDSLNFTPTTDGTYTFFKVANTSQGLQITVGAAASTSDGHDVFNVTPGALKVGSLSITDATSGQLGLGDLADFTAGLGS
jgi:hypothetical protein